MSLNLAEVERLKELIIEPMIATIQAELKPLVEAKASHEERLAKLEGNQKKALLGYAAIVTGVTTAISFGFNYVKSWVKTKFT